MSANNAPPPSSSPAGASAAPPQPSQFSSLLGSTIESIVHELLHSRSIYPPDSFALHRHLGVRCHASRVPQVGDYVADFLRVAVPTIVSGVADGLSLIILEEEVAGGGGGGGGDGSGGRRIQAGERTGATRTVERFVFRFRLDGSIGGVSGPAAGAGDAARMDLDDADAAAEERRQEAIRRDLELAVEARTELERSLRECLLRVITLRRRRRRRDERAENMSFKLCLHVAEDRTQGTGSDADDEEERVRNLDSCPDLMMALRQGEWLRPDDSSCLFSSDSSNTDGDAQRNNSSKGLLRPIKDVVLPSCGMTMQLGMEVNPF